MSGAASFGKRGRLQPAAPVPAIARSVTPAPQPVPVAVPSVETGLPLVTVALLLLFALVFACEVRFAPLHLSGFAIPVSALSGYGGVSGDLVFHQGQWWRILTAALLHGSLSHVVGNAIVFALIGFLLEPMIGSRWFAGLFAIGALGGSAGSLIFSPPEIVSVGASGAIMGVLAGAFICGVFAGDAAPRAPGWAMFLLMPFLSLLRFAGSSLSSREGKAGWRMDACALLLIFPSLIPMTMSSHTDYGAHLGGVVTGALTGIVMQFFWRKGAAHPAFGNLVAGFAAAWLAAALLAFLVEAQASSMGDIAPPGLVPVTEAPATEEDWVSRAPDLVARYPADPRAHLYRAIAFIRGRDLSDAEEQLRTALARAPGLGEGAENFAKSVNVFLALVLSYEGKVDEAETLTAPLCGFADDDMGAVHDDMVKRGLCS